MSQKNSPEGPVYDGWVHDFTEDHSQLVVELFDEKGIFVGESEIPRGNRICSRGTSIVLENCSDLVLHPPKMPKAESTAA